MDIREALQRGETLTGEAAAHAASCPVCSAATAGGDITEETAALFARVQREIEEERGFSAWLKSRSTPARAAAGAASAVALIALVAGLLPRTQFLPIPPIRVLGVLGVLGVLFAIALRLALRPLHASPPSRASTFAWFLAGLAAPAIFAVFPADAPRFDKLPQYTTAQGTVGCFVIGLLTGALLVVALRLLDRGGHRSRAVTLAAAVAGGVAANLALELHCPITAPGHLLLGHATVGVALVVAYGLALHRLVRAA